MRVVLDILLPPRCALCRSADEPLCADVHRRSALPRRADVCPLRPSHGAAGRRVPRVCRPPAGVRSGRRRSRLRGRRPRARPPAEERPAASPGSPGRRGHRDDAARGGVRGRVLGAGRPVAHDPARLPPGGAARPRGGAAVAAARRRPARAGRPAAAAAGARHGRQAAERPRGVPGPGASPCPRPSRSSTTCTRPAQPSTRARGRSGRAGRRRSRPSRSPARCAGERLWFESTHCPEDRP